MAASLLTLVTFAGCSGTEKNHDDNDNNNIRKLVFTGMNALLCLHNDDSSLNFSQFGLDVAKAFVQSSREFLQLQYVKLHETCSLFSKLNFIPENLLHFGWRSHCLNLARNIEIALEAQRVKHSFFCFSFRFNYSALLHFESKKLELDRECNSQIMEDSCSNFYLRQRGS